MFDSVNDDVDDRVVRDRRGVGQGNGGAAHFGCLEEGQFVQYIGWQRCFLMGIFRVAGMIARGSVDRRVEPRRNNRYDAQMNALRINMRDEMNLCSRNLLHPN